MIMDRASLSRSRLILAWSMPCDSRAPWYSAFSLKSPSERAVAMRFSISGICSFSSTLTSALILLYPARVMGMRSDMATDSRFDPLRAAQKKRPPLGDLPPAYIFDHQTVGVKGGPWLDGGHRKTLYSRRN